MLPSILGQAKEANRLEVHDRPAPYIGEEADEKKCELDVTYPIKNSMITDFDGMEEVRQLMIKIIVVYSFLGIVTF